MYCHEFMSDGVNIDGVVCAIGTELCERGVADV